MKTKIKFAMSKSEMKSLLSEAIVPIIPSSADYADALVAARDAFWSADSMAGNGMDGIAQGYSGKYLAIANINNGELGLYKNIE